MKANFFACVSLLALAVPGQVAAQDERADEVGQPSASEDRLATRGQVDMIVVSAERRDADVQDVPISVGVVGAEQLENSAVNEILELRSITPSLNVTNTNGYVNASIRGVGGGGVGPGVENQVAIYVDGVYYGSKAGSKLNFINVDQIEVLRGPQGTLFGRNATAGVLQVKTKKPSSIATGEFRATLENYSRIRGEGYLSGPLSDDVSADLAFSAVHQDGSWGTNLFDGSKNATVDRDIAVRSQILIEPSDSTSILLAGDYSTIEATTIAQQRNLPGAISGWVPENGPQPDIGYDTNINDPNNHYGHSWGLSGTIEQDLGAVRLVSITAYREDSYTFVFDYDYGPEDIEWITTTQPSTQFSQEIQLQAQPEDRLQWVVGGYYFRTRAEHDPFFLVGNDLGIELTVLNSQIAESFAGFAQATYDILPNTNLTAGIRYTDETREAVDGSTGVTLLDGNIPLPTTVFPDQSLGFSEWTYRVSLDHRFSDNFLIYASFNTGFKAGGFNTGAPGTAPYLPEKLEAWEAGFKSDLLDRRLRFNASAYYYDYTNIQVQQLLQGATTVTNGASATIYGFEADLTAVVTDNLTLTGGLSVADPKFDSYPNCLIVPPEGGSPGVLGSCDDKSIPLAPDVTFNAGANYSVESDFGRIDLTTNLYYNGGFAYTVGNSFAQDEFINLGASAKWTDPSDRFSAMIFGRNLTNERVANMLSVNTGNGTATVLWAAPRTYGITLGYKF